MKGGVWPLLIELLQREQPGLLGVQEMEHGQISAIEEARAKSADAVVELMGTETFTDLPTIVTGDFNTPAPDSESYDTLVVDGPLTDSWETATTQLTPQWGTFLGYEEPEEGARRIDWVLATEDVTVHEAAIDVSRGKDGRFPSDHAPVHALVELP